MLYAHAYSDSVVGVSAAMVAAVVRVVVDTVVVSRGMIRMIVPGRVVGVFMHVEMSAAVL
jgi:hypothetical protein